MSEQVAYSYDVFISCNPADQEWAENWLIPRLREAGLSVCTSHTLVPGAPKLVNI